MITKKMWKNAIDVVREGKRLLDNELIVASFVCIFAMLCMTPIFLAIDLLLLPLEIIYYFIK